MGALGGSQGVRVTYVTALLPIAESAMGRWPEGPEGSSLVDDWAALYALGTLRKD